jgi:hypothetical protein
VRQTIASTMRTVRNAYWNLAFAHAGLRVQQQSLELAQESLRNTRSRVEIGTTPPIDIVEAESEVAQREEAVIVGEAQIQTAEDTEGAGPRSLHAGLLDCTGSRGPAPVSADHGGYRAAVRNALDKCTDLQ